MNLAETLDRVLQGFRPSQHVYRSDKPIEAVRQLILSVVNQKMLDLTSNLTGYLKADDTFHLSRKFGFTIIDDGTGATVTMEGKLKDRFENGTEISITIKPNRVLIYLPLLFCTVAAMGLISSIVQQNTNDLLGLLFLVVVPISWMIINMSKKYYKKEFEEALKLKDT